VIEEEVTGKSEFNERRSPKTTKVLKRKESGDPEQEQLEATNRSTREW